MSKSPELSVLTFAPCTGYALVPSGLVIIRVTIASGIPPPDLSLPSMWIDSPFSMIEDAGVKAIDVAFFPVNEALAKTPTEPIISIATMAVAINFLSMLFLPFSFLFSSSWSLPLVSVLFLTSLLAPSRPMCLLLVGRTSPSRSFHRSRYKEGLGNDNKKRRWGDLLRSKAPRLRSLRSNGVRLSLVSSIYRGKYQLSANEGPLERILCSPEPRTAIGAELEDGGVAGAAAAAQGPVICVTSGAQEVAFFDGLTTFDAGSGRTIFYQ